MKNISLEKQEHFDIGTSNLYIYKKKERKRKKKI